MEEKMNLLYEKTDNFYNQKIYLTNIRESRFDFFVSICSGKKVMHVGCADAMAFKENSNLHIFLNESNAISTLDGLDINIETINKLNEICPGNYYTDYTQVKNEYDIVIVPEVMEHVPNIDLFLRDIFSIKSKQYFITVPSVNAIQIFCDDCFTLEMVHPDHKVWFSPYTLYNTVKPFLDSFDYSMYYLENKSQIGINILSK